MQLPQWLKEIRGNAAWDAAKWVWASGGAIFSTAVQAMIGWARGHQDLSALLIPAGAAVFLAAVALIDRSRPHLTSAPPDVSELIEPPPPFVIPSRALSLEEREANRLRNEFEELKWTQQAAFAKLCQMTSATPDVLRQILQQLGFGLDIAEGVIKPLMATSLVETNQSGKICPHPARITTITTLVKMWHARGI